MPADLTGLATRATSGPSVARAVDRLDLAGLQVLDVLATLPEPTTAAAVSARWGADAAPVLATFRAQALVWGGDDDLRLVRAVRASLREPAGLGPGVEVLLTGASPGTVAAVVRALAAAPTGDVTRDAAVIAGLLGDPDRIEALLATAPAGAREALGLLVWGPPSGTLPDARRRVDADAPRSPVEWLLAHGLLVPVGPETVALPQEVGLDLRGGRVHADPAPRQPELVVTVRDPGSTDRAAAQSAYDLVRRSEDLLEAWGIDPPAVLRQGGLGVRELRRTAMLLDLDEPGAALLVEVVHAAGLLGAASDGEAWLPSPAYDSWLERSVDQRWAALARAWLESTRVPSLVGSRDERDKPMNALGPGLDRALAPELRLAVFAALAEAAPGATVGEQSLRDRLSWHRPRRAGRTRDALVAMILREAELMGITGRGALASAARGVIEGDEEAAAAVLAPLLPEPGTEILLQADLTLVAPGPLVPALARELALLAEVESTGGATVYRLSPTSVRRALDAGRSAGDLLDLLTRHSRTPVPQPVSYLLEDVARRHGRVRVGVATAYLRCDDPAVFTELLADRRAATLRLRRLAPTVIVSQAPVETVLERLRSMGLAPAAESADGELVVRRPDSRRGPTRPRPPRLLAESPAPPPSTLTAAVRALRAGDRAAAAVRRDPWHPGPSGVPRVATAEVVAQLRDAVVRQHPVVIGYVNAEASATERVVEPMSVEGGYVSAFDHLTDSVRTFAVARITGIAPALQPGS